eukprot:scaffold5_cov331-Pavlova_lutheri.AAC.68
MRPGGPSIRTQRPLSFYGLYGPRNFRGRRGFPPESDEGEAEARLYEAMAGSKRRATDVKDVDEEAMKHVERLAKQLRSEKAPDRSLAELQEVQGSSVHGLTCREVVERPSDEILEIITEMVFKIVQNIMDGNGFSYEVPSRARNNQMYVPELDRNVLKDNVSARAFANVSTSRKVAITTKVMQLVQNLCLGGINVTKRDLFYTDVKLFKTQTESDAVLEDISCMLGCTRSSLHVVASEKGVVVGNLRFREDGDEIDCSKMGVGGKAIPPNMDRVADLRSEAKFILLVEKDAAFMRLAEDRFYNKYPCVIITGKGSPDVATRLFLKRMKQTLKIPVLGLVDSDPYGLKILSVYMSGSKNMSYDSASLTTPDIKWLGVRPSDLDRYNIPEQCRLDMEPTDIKTGQQMLQEDFIKANPEWIKELELMLKTKTKAEIQSLSSFGFQYLTQVYLPRKLREGDWI